MSKEGFDNRAGTEASDRSIFQGHSDKNCGSKFEIRGIETMREYETLRFFGTPAGAFFLLNVRLLRFDGAISNSFH